MDLGGENKLNWVIIGSGPTTPDPNTSAKASRYKWEAYRDTNWWCMYYSRPAAKSRAYFCKSIATEMGGVSRYFSKVSGSGVDVTLLISMKQCPPAGTGTKI